MQRVIYIIIGAIVLLVIILALILLIRAIRPPAAPQVPTPTPTLTVVPTPSPTPSPTPTPERDRLPLLFLIPKLRETPTPTPTPTLTPIPTPSPTPVPPRGVVNIPPPPTVATQTIIGRGFTLQFPQNWGVLTCSNSSNFEFDPNNNIDQIGVLCDFARLPITVIVQNNLAGCPTQTTSINGIPVRKSVTTRNDRTTYEWCTVTQPVLSITHRVSPTPSRGESSIDHSVQVEQIIGTFQNTNSR